MKSAWGGESFRWRLGEDEGARRALARRRRRRRLRAGFAWSLVGAAALALGVGVALGWNAGTRWLRTETDLLRVQQVDVSPTSWVPPWTVVSLAGIGYGDDLLSIAPDSVSARLEAHPRVARARVRRTLARRVKLELVERPPVATWLGDELLEVAADGTVLGAPPTGRRPQWPVRQAGAHLRRGLDLPLITGVDLGRAGAGPVLDGEAVRQALGFLARLDAYRQPGEDWISEVWAGRAGELVAVTLGGVAVRIGDGRLSQRKVEAILAVLTRIRREGARPAYVDARFRNQVVIKQG